MKPILSLGAALFFLATLPAQAQTTAHIEFIDTGTPKNGTTLMTGWHGVIVRVVLDNGGPITRINFGDGTFGGYIAGNIAQRWTDPTGQGNYTQTSPGPLTANNTFDSDFNFDSHVLGGPGTYSSTTVTEFNAHDFLTSRTGLTSDGFVGYGATSYVHYEFDPIFFTEGGLLRGTLNIDPALQASSIDAAYVVTDSAFQVGVGITGSAGPIGTGAVFAIPEPGAIELSFAAAVFGLLTRHRCSARRVNARESTRQ